jgi:hypothetical protein
MFGGSFDPKTFVLTPEQVAAREQVSAVRQVERLVSLGELGRYAKGPVPAKTMATARRAHADGPLVLLAVKAMGDMIASKTGGPVPEIPVTDSLCSPWGVSRSSRRRAVRALEAAGLLTVVRESGLKAPRVRLAKGLFK